MAGPHQQLLLWPGSPLPLKGRAQGASAKTLPNLCPKFLLIDGWWQLGFDVHQRPLRHHQRIVIQEIHKEERLGRGGHRQGGQGEKKQAVKLEGALLAQLTS